MNKLGFLDGFRTLPSAFRRVRQNSKYWPYALVPALVLSALVSGATATLFVYGRPFLEAATLSVTGVSWVDRALFWASFASAGVGALFLSLVLTTPLSAPALERMVRLTEAELGAPTREPLGLFQEIWCGLRAQMAPLLWTGPAWVALFVVDAALPFLSPLTTAVRAVLASFGVAWGLLDYPLTLRGMPIRARLKLLASVPAPVLGFGGTFALLFWFPCCAVAFVGVGVVAATELATRIAARASHESSAALTR